MIGRALCGFAREAPPPKQITRVPTRSIHDALRRHLENRAFSHIVSGRFTFIPATLMPAEGNYPNASTVLDTEWFISLCFTLLENTTCATYCSPLRCCS